MKRIRVLALALAMVLSSAAMAKADGIGIKVKGQWDFAFGWGNNMVFKESYMAGGRSGEYARARKANKDHKSRDNDNFEARHRVRTQIDFIASEYLQAVLMFEIGNLNWGRGSEMTNRAGNGAGGGLDADGVNIETKRAYLDWIIPNTNIAVRMGIQGLALPSTPMASPVLKADVAGILLSSPITDWLSASLFWLRPFDAYYNDGSDPASTFSGDNFSDEVDVFGIVLPVTLSDYGVKFSPWFIYGFVGANSAFYDYQYATRRSYTNSVTTENSNTQVYWIGGHLKFTLLDPLVFNIEGIYGHLSPTELGGFGHTATSPGFQKGTDTVNWGTSGWFIAATLDYKLDFMTPGIFGWYASGDDANSDHSGKMGRMPVLGNDGGSFKPTSFGSAGYYGITQNSNTGTIIGTGTGSWGVGLQLADISFIKDLSHTFRVAYYRGTNDAELLKGDRNGTFLRYRADGFYLTDEDYVWEVNFDHQYKIYENLAAVLELGWLRLHADEDTWAGGNRSTSGLKQNDNAYKVQIAFRYTF